MPWSLEHVSMRRVSACNLLSHSREPQVFRKSESARCLLLAWPMSAADTRHPGLLMLNRGAVPPWATQACQGQFQLPSGTAQSTSAGAAAPGAPDSSPGSPLSAVCLQAHPLLARDGGPKLAFPPLGSNELNTWRDIWTEGKPRWFRSRALVAVQHSNDG